MISVKLQRWRAPSLPPTAALQPLLAEVELARDDRDREALEEIAVQLAGAVVGALSGRGRSARRPSARDERRVTRALRRIEASAEEPVAAVAFACDFNDLSTFNHRFRRVMGVSPRAYRARRRTA